MNGTEIHLKYILLTFPAYVEKLVFTLVAQFPLREIYRLQVVTKPGGYSSIPTVSQIGSDRHE
jgi:hypothetical protein